jgi:hypothetical protein
MGSDDGVRHLGLYSKNTHKEPNVSETGYVNSKPQPFPKRVFWCSLKYQPRGKVQKPTNPEKQAEISEIWYVVGNTKFWTHTHLKNKIKNYHVKFYILEYHNTVISASCCINV